VGPVSSTTSSSSTAQTEAIAIQISGPPAVQTIRRQNFGSETPCQQSESWGWGFEFRGRGAWPAANGSSAAPPRREVVVLFAVLGLGNTKAGTGPGGVLFESMRL
jgi:hypothetical protein